MTQRTQSTEEYLEAIFKLQRTGHPVTVKQLAADLGISPPSVSEMLRRMCDRGLVAQERSDGIQLTPQGELEGARLVRRHRLSERFLVDYLDMPWDAVHDEACKLEHVLSPEVEKRLAAQLGHPKTCPHGHAIPDADGRLEEEELTPLGELRPGERGVIACIAQEDSELLRYLGSLGLVPETVVAVDSIAPFGGPYLIRVDDAQYALGRAVADMILLRR
ncbi:MAG: metal-dependent transcriptional regulator [Thermoleophilia bacterium]